MKHYIVIRMNMQTCWRELDRAYIEYRLELFRLSTLKALQAQTQAPDGVILMSEASMPPDLWQAHLDLPGCRVIHVPWKPDQEERYAPIRDLVRAEAGKANVVTTNLDSDDMPCRDYVQCVNSVALAHTGPHPLLIVPPRQHRTDLERISIERYADCSDSPPYRFPPAPPLFSLCESPVSRLWTCSTHGHANGMGTSDHVGSYSAARAQADGCYFVQMINVCNMSTGMKGDDVRGTFPPRDIVHGCGLTDADIDALYEFLNRKHDKAWRKAEWAIRKRYHRREPLIQEGQPKADM